MDNLSFYIARRIYKSSDGTKRISLPAIRIAILGMTVGIAVMIVSISVVLGFKHTIRDKVIGFGGHAVVKAYGSVLDDEQIPVCASDSLLKALAQAPDVRHLQPFSYTQGILKTDDEFLGAMFKGIDERWDSTFIHQNLVEGIIPHFSSQKPGNDILISKYMSDKLNLKVGEKVFAYFVGEDNVRTRRYRISGIYETHLSKFDEMTVYCDIAAVQKLNSWAKDQVSGIELSVNDYNRIDSTASWLVRHINRHTDRYGNTYTSETIQESNPQIFSWLDLLDLNVWLILALMICVATVTMVSGLLIIILERIPMIGVLKALGAQNAVIRRTFVWFGMFIVSKGIIYGNILGLAVCLIQKATGAIRLDPQIYYVTEAPVEIDIPVLLILNVAVLILCVVILTVPSYLVSHISPSRTIKFGE